MKNHLSKASFAVIYQGYVLPHLEEEYKKHWKIVASYFVSHRGALGSCLHKAEDGRWVAYSKWPDKAMRDACWPKEGESANAEIPAPVREAIEGIKKCIDSTRKIPEICMELVEEVSPIPLL